jgi:glycosyltransferase involved in cell wall biosynthesis
VFCDPWEPKNEPDSFRVVTAEAISCGLPVIAFDCPASREFVDYGENGFLVQNIEEMEAAILRYYKNPEIIRKHGLQSRIKALEKLSPEVITTKMAKFLHSL